MKYVWPYYLPSTKTAASSFFEVGLKSILTQLRESQVLESYTGIIVKPSSLKHVPLDPFADKEGIPFTLSPHTTANYLLLKYPPWAIKATTSISVSHLSSREFLEDLNSVIIYNPTAFRVKSAIWQSQLAEALVKLVTNAELLSIVENICLIPLNDSN